MIRNLHITIHEAALRRRQASEAGRRGGSEWDPTEPLETLPDPSDPTEPLETLPDPSDPTKPLETLPDPSDPTEPLETLPDPSDPTGSYAVWGAAGSGSPYGPVVRLAESSGVGHRAVVCCCSGDKKPSAAPRPGATPRDRSGFVIVRLAAGIDPGFHGDLWNLADAMPLPALKAALEMMTEPADRPGGNEGGNESENESENEGGGEDARKEPPRAAQPGQGKRLKEWVDDRIKNSADCEEEGGGGDDSEPSGHGDTRPKNPPKGALISRPLIELGAPPIPPAETLAFIRELERKAAQTSFPPFHSLAAYWRVDSRAHPDRIDEVVERFNALAEVDLAYAELTAADPSTGGFGADQGYLEDAPVGIGARWAWEALKAVDGTGTAVRVCDLEQRWHLGHQELDPAVEKLTIVGGHNRADNRTDFGHHGTAVLGQLAAVGANRGVSGTVGERGELRLASHYWGQGKLGFDGEPHPFRGTSGHVASAIVNLLLGVTDGLASGDVLLLEVQRGLLPTEIDAADFDAVRLASAVGVIVVEAGGNGGVDLDRYVDPDTGRSLNRVHPRFADSGAIVVGAARAALPHDRAAFSNHGSRVDCYAWGESVVSCGYGDLSGSAAADYYTNSFSGTSSAAPIVAGAAALVQALHQATSGSRLMPRAMRSALSDPRSGTAQGRGVAGRIGVMPDLCALIRDRLQLVPDLYMRHRVGDDGTRPAGNGAAGSSPDIFRWKGRAGAVNRYGPGVRANLPAPGTAFAWNAPDAQEGELFVRLRNRGGAPGSTPVRLYAARAATLITPERWAWIGDVDVKDVPVGDTLTVEGPPVGWRPRAPAAPSPPGTPPLWIDQVVPPLSFLAVHGEGAALPPAPPYFDWDEYRRFLRGPRAAWRNVHEVQVGAELPATGVQLAFLIGGTPDQGREFDLEVLQRLPAGIEVTLEVSDSFADKIRQRVHWSSGAPLVLPSRARTPLGRIHLARGCLEPAAFRLKVRVPPPAPSPVPGTGHSLAIRQLWRGEEVGRITWWLAA